MLNEALHAVANQYRRRAERIQQRHQHPVSGYLEPKFRNRLLYYLESANRVMELALGTYLGTTDDGTSVYVEPVSTWNDYEEGTEPAHFI